MAAREETEKLEIEVLGHEIAVVIGEATTTIEFDCGITVIDLKVKDPGVVFARYAFGKVKETRADSLPTMSGGDKEFVDPGTFAAIFKAKVEANHQVADGRIFISHKINNAVDRILQEFDEVRANGGFVKGFFPSIVDLHVAHQAKQRFEVGKHGAMCSDRHRRNRLGLRQTV
jgi:hypothetical protein